MSFRRRTKVSPPQKTPEAGPNTKISWLQFGSEVLTRAPTLSTTAVPTNPSNLGSKMKASSIQLRCVLSLLLFFVLPFSSALKFDILAHPGGHSNKERCIRNFVSKDTLVVVTAIVGGSKGDGQQVNMQV